MGSAAAQMMRLKADARVAIKRRYPTQKAKLTMDKDPSRTEHYYVESPDGLILAGPFVHLTDLIIAMEAPR